jgi:HMG (high mobility group) box
VPVDRQRALADLMETAQQTMPSTWNNNNNIETVGTDNTMDDSYDNLFDSDDDLFQYREYSEDDDEVIVVSASADAIAMTKIGSKTDWNGGISGYVTNDTIRSVTTPTNSFEITKSPHDHNHNVSSTTTIGIIASPMEPKTLQRIETKKRKGMPKRPLSAYNIYFRTERRRLVTEQQKQQQQQTKGRNRNGTSTKGKISFEELGKRIGKSWQLLNAEEKQPFVRLSSIDVTRYRNEMSEMDRLKEQKRQLKQLYHSNNKDTIPFDNTEHCYDKGSVDATQSRSFPNEKYASNSVTRLSATSSLIPHSTNIYDPRSDYPAVTFPFRDDSTTTKRNNDDNNNNYKNTTPSQTLHESTSSDYDRHHSVITRLENELNRSTSQRSESDAMPKTTSHNILPILFGPPSLISHVHRALPPRAIQLDNSNSSVLPTDHRIRTEVIMPDHSGTKRLYHLEYHCFRMPKQDADQYLQILHWYRNNNNSEDQDQQPQPNSNICYEQDNGGCSTVVVNEEDVMRLRHQQQQQPYQHPCQYKGIISETLSLVTTPHVFGTHQPHIKESSSIFSSQGDQTTLLSLASSGFIQLE